MQSLLKLKNQDPEIIPLLTKALGDPDKYNCIIAAQELRKYGSKAEAATIPLIRLLDHKDVEIQQYACITLGAIGPKAKDAGPKLVALLETSKDQESIFYAAQALWGLKVEDAKLVPVLVKFVNHPDSNIRCRIIGCIGNIGPPAKSTVPFLIGALDDKDFNVRLEAAQSLGKIGPSAKEAIPALKSLQNDPNVFVQEAAETALSRIMTNQKK